MDLRADRETFQPVVREELTTWEDIDSIRSKTRPLLHRIIDETPDEELNMPTKAALAAPARAPSEIIAHILLHERGHHGDVTTLLSALGVTLPLSDYLVFAFFRDRPG
ncbi:MAG: DinB family protein [Dehalococcoidia bacterium]